MVKSNPSTQENLSKDNAPKISMKVTDRTTKVVQGRRMKITDANGTLEVDNYVEMHFR
jgi:hypothetical protein